MNRYTALGLAAIAATAGEKILFVTETQTAAREAFRALVDASSAIHSEPQLRCANGSEEIKYADGGRILFRSLAGSGHRGVAVDTIYVDGPDLTPDRLIDLAPAIATSTTGRIVYA